ncbi:sensor histidine kinase [Paenibacillus sp. GD4]|uniref:cache domain-containing sensor histidine kinase n=1 Tax=Paenibacillus sp. GD4 TaxID=3068890 RepID=UPI0027965CF2|nr:sensor histidine kinase [Paenibacillus sp. GD4]MDQ1913641.1 sensor histidine kinase [Paenibacillus sp. GD4]
MWNTLRTKLSGIRTVLLLSYFVIIVLCISSVGTLSFYISYQSMAERVETASAQMVKQMEKNLDNEFHNKRNVLLAPYYSQEYIDSINAYATMEDQTKFLFRRQLGDLFLKGFTITPIPDFVRFQIYYSSGELINGSDHLPQESPSKVRESSWFQQTIAKDGKMHLFRSGPNSEAAQEGASYSTSLLIRDFANPVAYIIVRADYSQRLFQSIEQNDDLTDSSEIWILDESDQWVYASSGINAAGPDQDILSQMNGEGGRFWTSGDADRKLVSYTKSAYSNWKTVLVMPKQEIFSPLDPIKTAAFYTGIVVFFVTSLMSLLFGRFITSPILQLHKTVNHIKRGDFSIRANIDRSDEIGRIAMNFNAMLDELQKLIETKYVYQIRLQEAQLAVLYSQINPHFLYNTLDSIKAMADYHQVDEIGEMVHSLADMFRYNTKSSDEVVTLGEELVQIRAYMNIQRIRFDDRIGFELQIDSALYDFPLLKMTLQPLVENAVSHGLERKRGKGTIRVGAELKANSFVLSVEDDGLGMSERRLERIQAGLRLPLYQDEHAYSSKDGGIGIRNVHTRYAIRYGERYRFDISSRKGAGTRITITLELDGRGK